MEELAKVIPGRENAGTSQSPVAIQGFLWTMLTWLPGAVILLFPYNEVAAWESNLGGAAGLPINPSSLALLLLAPGALLAGFATACGLSGGAGGAWRGFLRGAKAVSLLSLAIACVAAESAIMDKTGDPERVVYAWFIFSYGILTLLTGGMGGICRYFWDRYLAHAPSPV